MLGPISYGAKNALSCRLLYLIITIIISITGCGVQLFSDLSTVPLYYKTILLFYALTAVCILYACTD